MNFVPTAPPIAIAAITKASQPMIAALRCWALQRPARAARLLGCISVPPGWVDLHHGGSVPPGPRYREAGNWRLRGRLAAARTVRLAPPQRPGVRSAPPPRHPVAVFRPRSCGSIIIAMNTTATEPIHIPVSTPPRRPITVLKTVGRDLGYLLAAFAMSIVGFVVWVTGLSVTLALLVLIVGLFVWIATAYVRRWTTPIDRALAGWLGGSPVRAA